MFPFFSFFFRFRLFAFSNVFLIMMLAEKGQARVFRLRDVSLFFFW